MNVRIGRIAYLNTEPFFRTDEVRAQSIAKPPRQTAEMALRHEVDLAPLPVVAHLDNPGRFRIIGPMGIACDGPVRSVILKSRTHPADLSPDATIGVIGETATSVRLLRILLAEHFRVPGPLNFADLAKGQDAQLLIGDRALAALESTDEYPWTIDLGEAWKELTGRPFVFALWLARADLPERDEAEIVSYFDESLAANLADGSEIHRRRPDLRMSLDAINDYIRMFDYRISDEAMDAVDQFREMDQRIRRGVAVS